MRLLFSTVSLSVTLSRVSRDEYTYHLTLRALHGLRSYQHIISYQYSTKPYQQPLRDLRFGSTPGFFGRGMVS